VINVPAGAQVTAQFHRTAAGYLGPDPADPIDPTNKGKCTRSGLEFFSLPDCTFLGPVIAYL
jgi:hypothetical protein